MSVTNYQISLTNATWIDVNTRYMLNSLPDRLPDSLAITHSSLYNLFNCPIGARGRIFQPEYGSLLHRFLQEPIDETTAEQMRLSLIQSLARWEPRIKLDYGGTYIQPDLTLPGYHIRISGIEVINNAPISIKFSETVS